MKILRIFIFSLLLTSLGAFAQGGSYYGVNRDLRDNRTPKPPTPEEIEKNRNDNVEKYMVKLKAALNLDELQSIAIKNEIMANSKNVDIVMKKEEDVDKATEVKAIMEKTDIVINSYLNKEQKEKYLIFKANVKPKKKEKKGKKAEEEKTSEE